jgi:hypothetical protein
VWQPGVPLEIEGVFFTMDPLKIVTAFAACLVVLVMLTGCALKPQSVVQPVDTEQLIAQDFVDVLVQINQLPGPIPWSTGLVL